MKEIDVCKWYIKEVNCKIKTDSFPYNFPLWHHNNAEGLL